MVNYSAFHWSEKARKSAEEAKSIKESLGVVYIFKGSVNTIADLPENANIGDVYDVLDSGTNYAWAGDRWDSLGAAFDLSEYAKKEYVDTTEQEIIQNFMDADTALQTQITGLSDVLDGEQDKITAIEGKIPTNASTSNLLSTASDLLNATQNVRSDFAEADSELQTQINGQATAISDLSDDVMANMGEIADLKTGKQDKLTAGENITINENVISATSELDGKITNCITEIPQDIKMELNNGTLTLKAGSKVYVPNGFEADGITLKFDVVTTNSDLSISYPTNGEMTLYYDVDNSSLIRFFTSADSSGGTTPTDQTTWYDITNNILRRYDTGGTLGSKLSLPLCHYTVSDGVASSIDQVFNGFGYIGSTVFALPGVKGLIPNGRNEDGSLKNIEFTVGSVKTFTSNYTGPFNLVLDNNNLFYNGLYWYSDKENINYDGTNKQYMCNIGTCNTSNGVIIIFKPKTTFHALDYNNNHCVIESYRNGSNWYRVWSDGWVEQGGQVFGINNNSDVTVTLLKAMRNTEYSVIIGQKMAFDVAYTNQGTIISGSFSKTGFAISNRRFNGDASRTIDIIWEVRGMGA